MHRILKTLQRSQAGQTALEYALIAGVVAIALIGAVKGLIVPMFQEDGEAAKAIKAGIMQAAGKAE
jgi:Flp pilus assembly pilin Flp